MRWIPMLIMAFILGCASDRSAIDSQQLSFLETTAPLVSGCQSIQTKYTDLSKAPAELVADKDAYAPPMKLVQVWVMAGCKDGVRMKVDVVADGRGGGVMMGVKY